MNAGIGVGETAGALFKIGGAVGIGTLGKVSLSGIGTVTGATLGAGLLVGRVVVRGDVCPVRIGALVGVRKLVLPVWAEASATVITHDATIPRYLILFIKFPFVN